LFVFNPHAWASAQNIEYDLSLRKGIPVTAEDGAGKPVPSQWTQATTAAGRTRLVAQVSLPAFGYEQIRIKPVDAEIPVSSTIKAAGNVMENEHIRVTFSAKGTLGIYDKDAGREVFKGGATGARAVVFKDENDTWAHNFVAYTDELGSFKQDSIKLVERGPLRSLMRVHYSWGKSSITTDWILYAGARNLEARVSLDWHEHLKMLKYSFSVDVENPKATYEIAYGAMVRATKNEEDPGQRWVDVDGDRGGSQYGFAVINDAKYGYSVERSDLRVSVARGAIYAIYPEAIDKNQDHYWQDQGMQTFRMILAPHAGVWQDAGIVRAAEEMMASPVIIYQGIHRGTRPLSDSFLSVDAPNVIISAIKQAEDGDDVIVRMYESAGRATTAHVDLKFAHARWTGQFHPFEIKTLRIKAKTSAISEVNILEH
jgi:alpha-mannosidase